MYLAVPSVLHLSLLLAMGAPATGDSLPPLLVIPDGGTLRCEMKPVTKPAAGREVAFEFGEPLDTAHRTLRATFDSTGRPHDLMEILSVLDRGHGYTNRTAIGRFVSDTVVGLTSVQRWSWKHPEDRLMLPKDSVRSVYVEMTPAEGRQVRVLAEWIWRHRCPGETGRTKRS